jgi:phosphoribosylanthranilate isomerase
MLVKVGGITNLSDARYCAGMGVEMLGFGVVEGQDNYLDAEKFQEIRGWVTGPRVVAELFGIQHPEALETIIKNYRPDYLELGLKEIALFPSLPVPFILSLKDTESSQNLPYPPSYVHRDSLSISDDDYPVILRVFSIDDLKSSLENSKVHGISMRGNKELRPGLKDYELLAEVLEQLDEDN